MSSHSSGSLSSVAKNRITRELSQIASDPPPGTACYCPTDNLTYLHATIAGPPDSPFTNGIYLLTIHIPTRYPFEPPKVRFQTPIHHPNIDSHGRICLDTLKQRPAGSWSPAVSLSTLLLSIRALMERPNGDDGLVTEITAQFQNDYRGWCAQATSLAEKEATYEKLVEREEKIKESILNEEHSRQGDGIKNFRAPVPRSSRIFGRKKDKENQLGMNMGRADEEDEMIMSDVATGKRKGLDHHIDNVEDSKEKKIKS
eukprot:CAMPEP_0176500164 /NCGR_PEP_ID=MMETSP0200_2-20121128/13367_1 /TAXON_ID=947934 /ORGANISM="Chaetoceros sp., Strain GSL56" /LENGTH=256 /DNA_ID=CAMNT_0017898737 /DNA_START=30 /DNA_END=800 /DNA_ORIENTATION=-